MLRSIYVSSLCVFLSSCFHSSKTQPGANVTPASEPKPCQSAKEYVTTLNYLKSKELTQLSEERKRDIAFRVATYCEGAADRFIKVSELLLRAQLGPRDSIEKGVQYASLSNAHAQAFVEVFKANYLKEMLDMDLLTSLKTAESVSNNPNLDAEVTKEDYFKLVKFCLASDRIAQSRPYCVKWAGKMALYGKPGHPVANAFTELFTFLTQDDGGPKLATHDAIKVSEDVFAKSPLAGKDFIEAYQFASSKKGHDWDRSAAAKFAQRLIVASHYESPVTEEKTLEKQPKE
ncbi:MAG: hypothetical protein AB7T49_07275 [Oligoflexales bacterium]